MLMSRAQIIGLGASTPIGRNVWASAAAARAGICGFSEHPFMIDTAGEPMCIARAPWIDINFDGVDRYCHLLFPAMDEALVALHAQIEKQRLRVGLALALPPCRPGSPEALAQGIQSSIADKYPGFFSQILCFEVGHAAGHLALENAVNSTVSGVIDVFVVAGVDSYLAPETLEWIEECDQLHGAGPLNNAWGFIPGEAAGALVVASGAITRRSGVESYGEVVSVGIGRETKLIKTEAVCIGEGLTQAIRSALSSLASGERIHNVYCDLNGEPYRSDEYGFSVLRTKEWFLSANDFVAPADCWGDIGAAGLPMHVALAVISHRKRYGKGPMSMVCASSESGERGAVIIKSLDARGS